MSPGSSWSGRPHTRWAGYALSALPVLALLVSGGGKLLGLPAAVGALARLGFPERLAVGLGIVELSCTLLYAIPRTAVLGAVLLTGYLGGATAAHVRIGERFAIPVALGALVWSGLLLRDPRLRSWFLPR